VPNVVFVAPYLLASTRRFVHGACAVPGARVALVTSEPAAALGPALSAELARYVHVGDCLDPAALRDGVREAGRQLGSVQRLLGILENLQEPLAHIREELRITGMDAAEARRFRDKAVMKDTLRAAGVPCARHGLARNAEEAWRTADHCGFPLVVKPPEGAGARGTFRAQTAEQFGQWLAVAPPTPEAPAQIEEFVVGEEFSYDSVTLAGTEVWHSINRYQPSPLTVIENPWIQWTVVLPRHIDGPEFDPVRGAARAATAALGMWNGLSHLEWFRRPDGTVAVSEVGARPPGAQFSTLISLAHEFDLYQAWPHLMIHDEFHPPARRWAVGAAYLRAQGHGRIRAVHGIDSLDPWVRELVVSASLPDAGTATSGTYEGDGVVVLRHAATDMVERALMELVSKIRLEVEG
jgi:biotin carboxylase